MVSAATITHDAYDAAKTRGEIDANPNASPSMERAADTNEVSGKLSKPVGEPDDNSGDKSGDRRETRRKPRRLMDKEIGNVVEGQRNMPEILSPCG
ncbi:hypothetical protein P0D88_06885 [Paraburkholderia sp. RL18-103-BIB-C]|jgi:hypothetical protein|uniref:hypothetical protein n=1 Tax=unclassified Paraburkholderia TaxID=2615204 RepID=UPI002F518EF7